MQEIMTTEQWLLQILLGGLMGVIGQGIRTIPGLKKLNDTANAKGKLFTEEFQTSVLMTSLFTGFIAGALATFATTDETGELKISKEVLMGLAAAGYGGADFVEGFVKKHLPAAGPQSNAPKTIDQPTS